MYHVKRKVTIAGVATATLTVVLLLNSPASAANNMGEAKFKEHCAACHVGGGNIIKADKTLSRKDREAHGIKTAMDIVRLMRKPGAGMTTFDKKTISDKEAKTIADYIIKTFK